MKYPNVEAYVKEHGYEMKDLTPEEIQFELDWDTDVAMMRRNVE